MWVSLYAHERRVTGDKEIDKLREINKLEGKKANATEPEKRNRRSREELNGLSETVNGTAAVIIINSMCVKSTIKISFGFDVDCNVFRVLKFDQYIGCWLDFRFSVGK